MPLRPILKAIPPLSLPFPKSLADDDFTEESLSATSSMNDPLPFGCLSQIPLDSPHVHFPPTPTLTRIEITHSKLSYDRKPISISPNLCALPGRGERIFDYFKLPTNKPRSFDFEEGYASSRASGFESRKPFERRRCLSTNSKIGMRVPSPPSLARRPGANSYPKECDMPPALIFDPSSESESDACVSPPADLSLPPRISHISTHFRGEGPLTRNGQRDPGSFLSNEEHNSAFSRSAARLFRHQSPKNYSRWENNGITSNSEKQSQQNLDKAMSLDNITACSIKRARTRARDAVTDAHVGTNKRGFESSSFCEPGLDGCLGGF